MSDFFTYLSDHQAGVLLLIAVVLALALFVQWIAWIFSWGRFSSGPPDARSHISFILADLLVKIIDDFRHLLALLITLIYAAMLGLAVGGVGQNNDMLQTAVSALGGLIASIIGYYFGESRSNRQGDGGVSEDEAPPEIEQDAAVPPIQVAPPPPSPSNPTPPDDAPSV